MMSVNPGDMARKQASNQEVKDFGRHMASAHGQAQKDLMAIADKNHIEYRRDMDREENNTVKHMSTLKGREFDRAFMRHVIEDTKKTWICLRKWHGKGQIRI
jgi:putative membrane protein